RNILTEQIRSWNFVCETAEDGYQGLQLMMRRHSTNLAFDLVILDFQMPGMDGRGVVERMRAQPELAATPVILLVAADRSESDAPKLGAGELVLLGKPVRASLLYETITTILGDSKPGRKLEWQQQPASQP